MIDLAGRALVRANMLYGLLEDQLTPTRRPSRQERVSGGNEVEQPTPADMRVVEHRHKLVRGLRWWTDAVRLDESTRIGESVPRMCTWLICNLQVMDPDDLGALAEQLDAWNGRAARLCDSCELDLSRVVPVHDAATSLGVSVRTIQRRVPREHRPGGVVLLREAWRCELCDLRWGECPHTRTTSV